MSSKSTQQNHKSERENNLSSGTGSESIPSDNTKLYIESPQSPINFKNSQEGNFDKAKYYHEDEEYEYFRVPKNKKVSEEKGISSKPSENINLNDIKNDQNIQDIQDVSFEKAFLIGKAPLNLRF